MRYMPSELEAAKRVDLLADAEAEQGGEEFAQIATRCEVILEATP